MMNRPPRLSGDWASYLTFWNFWRAPSSRTLFFCCSFVLQLTNLSGSPNFREILPGDRPILHSFMMGTNPELTPQENISTMTFMEKEVLRIANERGCVGVLTTNTNELTQQLAGVNAYETLLDYQVNQYIVDGYRPFGKAADDYRAMVQYKKL